jgi:hypothetical protein
MKQTTLTFVLAAAFALSAAPAYAAEMNGASAASSTTSYNVACVQTALDVRETALITAHTALNTAIVQALTVRKDSLKAAWALTDKKARNTARTASWTAFKTSSETAHKAMRDARKGAYTTFNTTMKACGVKGFSEQAHTMNSNAAL